jgi:hypothetical protein
MEDGDDEDDALDTSSLGDMPYETIKSPWVEKPVSIGVVL